MPHAPRPSPRHPISALLVALLGLSLAILACAGPAPGAPSPTPSVPPTTAAGPTTVGPTATTGSGGIVAGSLEVRGTSSYIDSFNYFHLVGEVFNNTEQPVTGIELMAHVADAAGQAATDGDGRPMDGEIFTPLLYTLAPGESAPFDFFRLLPDETDIDGWQTSATVAAHTAAEVARAEVEITSTRVFAKDGGTVYLTGELVNGGAHPVEIKSFAAALVAPAGQVLAANGSTDFSGFLAPAGDPAGGDRTPFVVAIDGPAEAGANATFFVDAETTEPLTSTNQVDVVVTHRYADEFDDLHLTALVTNTGSETMTVRLVAGLYAADGAVLDTASATTPIYVAPGAAVPVSFDYFNSLNRSLENQALIDRVSVQVDPLWTYAIPYPVAQLQTTNEAREPVGPAQFSFRGEVVNSTEVEITSATLILAIYDGAQQLVATNWTNIYPETETLAPGASVPFDMSVFLPLDTDISDYSFSTLVQGYVKD